MTSDQEMFQRLGRDPVVAKWLDKQYDAAARRVISAETPEGEHRAVLELRCWDRFRAQFRRKETK